MAGFRNILLVLTGLLALNTAVAGIGLSEAIVDFSDPRKQRHDLWVINDGKERAYVAIEPAEIVNPGLPGEKRVTEPDPEKRGLLVSPTRMILEPEQRRMIRLVVIGDRQKERIYRVKIHPVTPPPGTGAEPAPATRSGIAIKVITGYDALVIVRPLEARANIVTRREGDELVFSNTGNTNALLFNGKQCDSKGKNCKDLPAMRLYAGASETITTPYHTTVSYEVMVGDDRRRQEFPGR